MSLFWGACGPTNAKLLEENKEFLEQLRKRVAQVRDAVDKAPPAARKPTCPAGLTAANTDFVLRGDLDEPPRKTSAQDPIDAAFLNLDSRLALTLTWSGGEYSIAKRPDERATPLLREVFQGIKSVEKVAVVKMRTAFVQPTGHRRFVTVLYKDEIPPTKTDFLALPELMGEVMLVDLASGKVACSFRFDYHWSGPGSPLEKEVISAGDTTMITTDAYQAGTQGIREALAKSAKAVLGLAVPNS